MKDLKIKLVIDFNKEENLELSKILSEQNISYKNIAIDPKV